MIENKTYYYPVMLNKYNMSRIYASLTHMFKNIKWYSGDKFTLKSINNTIKRNNAYMCVELDCGHYRATYCDPYAITCLTPLKINNININIL